MNTPNSWLRRLGAASILGLGLALLPAGASAEGATITCSGTAVVMCTGQTTEESGLLANFKMEKPANWNGTLVLYSHGYAFGASELRDVGDPVTGAWLLSHGYALAGSSYARSGWALQQAFEDQIAVLDVFKDNFGRPERTIAWGHSLGGMITAGLIQRNPHRFTAALPMCGVLAGGPGVWNQGLDSEFAFLTLQAPGAFKLSNFTATDVGTNFVAAYTAFNAAQGTKEGRARIALSSALADVPGWFDPTKPEPAATAYAARELNQLAWDNNPDLYFGFFGRFELEQRAGGNVSWNTGVDYRAQLAHSTQRAEVIALYAAAGLNLDAELNKLNAAPRIAANPEAVEYLSKYITYNGDIDMPVLTLHTTGDGLVEVTDEQAYASAVASAGDSNLLRQTYVHRAGHCTFSPAETISAFKTLVHRIDTGRWSGTDSSTLNAQATALGAGSNIIFVGTTVVPVSASFIAFTPGQFLRPFDARHGEGRGESDS